MIIYSTEKTSIRSYEVGQFYADWKQKPNKETFLQSIEKADYAVLAIDEEKNKIIGYITAITDHVLSAYIPFLEVDKSYQKQGIGTLLLQKILEQIGDLYMIDLIADKDKASFYEKAGLKSWNAMIKRNYGNHPTED